MVLNVMHHTALRRIDAITMKPNSTLFFFENILFVGCRISIICVSCYIYTKMCILKKLMDKPSINKSWYIPT